MSGPLFIGLMSGTSVDGIDAALVRFDADGAELLATREHPIGLDLKADIAAISQPGDNEVERLGILDRQLGACFAEASIALLDEAGVPAREVTAIGSHGQTIRHRPPSAGHQPESAFTLQIGDPNTIAELTGIDTVADFRRRDMAAGGEGAPLAPAFHRAVFAAEGEQRAIVNIGGIANVSALDGDTLVAGFDTGPGNTLLDQWYERHQGGPYDRGGAWAAEAEHDHGLLSELLAHPYFAGTNGPRSTGKEAFNLGWLDQVMADSQLDAQVVQATLAELTAETICRGIKDAGITASAVYICGGGAHNTDLMRRLYRRLSPATLETTEVLGIHPDWVEATAFAWLAQRALAQLAGNAPQVTGADGERVLGAIYPGGQA